MILLLACLCGATAGFAQAPASQTAPRALTHDDYDQWKSLRGTTYSQDGKWVAYQIEPQWGDGVLEVRAVDGDTIHRFPRGTGARFTADGRFLVFSVGKSKVEERDKKIADLRKKKVEKEQGNAAAGEAKAETEAKAAGEPAEPSEPAPQARGGGRRGGAGAPAGRPAGAGRPGAPAGGDGAADAARERNEYSVLELATGKVEALGKIKGFAAPDDVAVLLIHHDKPEPKKPTEAKDGAAAGKAEGGKAEAGKAENPPGAAAPTPVPAAEPAKEPAPEPAPAPVAVVPAAAEAKPEPAAAAAEPGKAAPARPAADPLERKRPEGTELVLRDLATGQERRFADVVAYGVSGRGKYLWLHTSAKKPAEGGKYGLFLVALPGGEPQQVFDGTAAVGNVTFARDEAALAFTSNLATLAAEKPENDLYLWNGDGMARRIAHVGAPGMPAKYRVTGGASFSRDGSRLSFSVQGPEPEELLPILPEDKVNLDLWHWQDGLLQTMQQKRGNGERNPSYTAVYHRDLARIATVGDETTRSLRFVGPNGRWMLGTDSRAYEREVQWDGRYSDVWLLDAVDSTKVKVLEKYRGNVTNSPGGRYLVWFGADYRWYSRDLRTGQQRDLTGSLPVPFHEHDDDHPEPDGAYGLAGWTDADAAVLLYDEFDVWRVDPASGDAVCVTDGYGRQNRLRLRLQRLPSKEDREYVDEQLYLAATNVDTMGEGVFTDSLSGNAAPQRVFYADKNLGELTRPVGSSRFFFTLGTFAQFPDLHVANADFTSIQRLTDANPQQAQFRWGKSELVRWIDGDGNPRSGILIKPDGFDPKQKYPMMVYFYERMTQGLHNYVAPAPGTSPNASYYVSNGYLWFMPDVVYEIGYPGNSCVKCVVSGVQHLIAQGFVDEKAIGAAGHSWGGYQTAFLVTRTNIFKAVESGAPVSNMLSAYGGIRYSTGMSRQFQYEQTQSRIGGTPWQYPLRYWENSPIHFADKVNTPVLMLHNDQDGAVPWTQGIEYFVALRRLGKEVYLFNYNGEDHGLRNRANMKDWTRRMAEYFGHHLKGEPAPKWMSDGVAFHERDAEKLPFAPSFVDAYVKPAPAAPAAVEPATTPAASEAATGVVDTVRPEAARAEGRRAGAARGEGRRGDRARTDTAPIPAKVVVGEPAPPFAAADEQGTQHALAGYQGRRLLLWFYPKANTPGCTAQGCGLRDEFAKLDAAGVAVLGVSVDDAVANARFRADHQLPFPLLCDTDRAVSLAYGAAAAADAPMARRIAVLVGPDGKVEKFWPRVEPRGFAAEVVAAVAPQ